MSDTCSAVKDAGNAAVHVLDKLPSTIADTLDALGQKFGAAGAQLWAMYVHYIQAYALSCMLGGDIVGIGALIFSRVLYKWSLEERISSDDRTGLRIASFFTGMGGLVIIALFTGGNLADVIAPQGAALSQILNKK